MAEMSRFDPLPELHASEDERLRMLMQVMPEAWDFASSSEQNWRPEHRAIGQDFATAAVLLDYCDGFVLERTPAQATKDGFTFSNVINGLHVSIDSGKVTAAPYRPFKAEFVTAFSKKNRLELVDNRPKYFHYQALRWAVDARMIELDHSQVREQLRRDALAAAG